MILKTILLMSIISYAFGFDSCKFDVITDFGHLDCDEEFFYFLNKTQDNCLPTCVEDIEDIEKYECDEWHNPCPPGYKCNFHEIEDKTQCDIIEDSCFKYHANYTNNAWKDAFWKPECLDDGTWAPRQCKGESSNKRCFCFDAFGKRLFGQEFDKKNSNMTCSCSRKRDELMKSASHIYPSLHCDTRGNYEPLQCYDDKCWCAEELTGEVISEIVPESMMKFLSCYSSNTIGETYLRQCESEEYAQTKILHELSVHGTKYARFQHLICDADGSYGAYKIFNGVVECRWRDNSKLNAEGSTVEYPDTDCNCVRDRRIFKENGFDHSMECIPNGNYRPDQIREDRKFYCVDSDGYRKSEFFDQKPTNCSDYI